MSKWIAKSFKFHTFLNSKTIQQVANVPGVGKNSHVSVIFRM